MLSLTPFRNLGETDRILSPVSILLILIQNRVKTLISYSFDLIVRRRLDLIVICQINSLGYALSYTKYFLVAHLARFNYPTQSNPLSEGLLRVKIVESTYQPLSPLSILLLEHTRNKHTLLSSLGSLHTALCQLNI